MGSSENVGSTNSLTAENVWVHTQHCCYWSWWSGASQKYYFYNEWITLENKTTFWKTKMIQWFQGQSIRDVCCYRKNACDNAKINLWFVQWHSEVSNVLWEDWIKCWYCEDIYTMCCLKFEWNNEILFFIFFMERLKNFSAISNKTCAWKKSMKICSIIYILNILLITNICEKFITQWNPSKNVGGYVTKMENLDHSF